MIIKEKYLCCIDCGGDLVKNGKFFICRNCARKFKFDDGIFDCMEVLESEKEFSRNKWDKFYNNWFGVDKLDLEYKKFLSNVNSIGIKQIRKYYRLENKSTYFELGCGTFFLGSLFAKDCKLVIGIDFSLPALLAAKKILDKNGIKNYLLIRGDIFKIPLKDKVIDLLYGGGVIEHFKDTKGCIKEFSRIMKKGGVALNAVPLLNIGSLTYRQIWGNIPDFPVLKQLAEWVHLKLLKGKHMYFGYELSFTKSKLISIHKKFGFRNIKCVRLDTEVKFDFFPKFIRPVGRYLANNCSWFWPMMLVVAKK